MPTLKFWDGTQWRSLNTATAPVQEVAIATTSPGSPAGYDLWVDTSVTAASDSVLALLENPPKVLVQRTAVLTLGAGAFTAIPWDTVGYNPFNIWASGAPTRLTIPTAGLYHFDFGLVPVYVASNRVGVQMQVNGVAVKEAMAGVVAQSCTANISFDHQMAAGDYIEAFGWSQLATTAAANLVRYNFMNARWVCP